jgi:hypothetical protein
MRFQIITVVAAMLLVGMAAQGSVSTSYDLSTNPVATLSGTQALGSLTLTNAGTLTINGSSSPTVNYGDYTYLSVGTGQTINNTGNVAWNVTTGDYLQDTWDSYFRIVGGSWTGTSTVNGGGGALYFDSAYSGGAYHGATVTGTHTFNAGYVFLDGLGTTLTGTYTINIDTTYPGGPKGDEGFYISDEGNFFNSAYGASYGYSATTFASTGGTINGNVYVGRGSFLGSGTHITGDVWMGSGKFMGNHTIDGSLNVRTYSGLGNAPNNQIGWWWYPTGAAVVSPSSTIGTVGTMTVGGSATLDSNTTLQFQLGSSGVNDRMTVTGPVLLGQDTHTPLTLNILPATGFYIAPGGSALNYTLITGSSLTGTVAIGSSADLAGKVYSYTPTYTGNSLGLTVSRLSGASIWLGTGGNTNFSTPGNWDNGVPSGSLNAGADLGGNNTITMDAPATFASLSIGGMGNWTVNGSSALNATQLFYATSGTSTISAPLSADLTMAAGALTISGAMSGNMAVSAGSLTVNGSSAGTGNINVTGSGSMILAAPLSGSGSITVNSSAYPAMAMSGPQYYTGTTTVNNGALTVTGDMGAGNIIIDSTAAGSAYMYLQGGTISAGSSGSVLRLVAGSSGGSTSFYGWGTVNRNMEVAGTGSGYIYLGNNGAAGTTLTINGNVTDTYTGTTCFAGYAPPVVINGNLTSSTGTVTNNGNLTVSGLTNVYSLSNTGTLNALGGLIVGTGNFNFDPTPANLPSYMQKNIGGTLTWAGTLGTGSGWITVMNNSELSSVSSFTLGGAGTLGHIYITDDGNGANDNGNPITPSITLSGEGGELINSTWYGCGWPNSGQGSSCPFTGQISGSGNLFLGRGYVTTLAGSSDNTYTGDTKVLGWTNVLSTARALNGNVTVVPGAWLTLNSANNVDSAKSVYVGSIRFASPMMDQMGSVGVLDDFVPNIDPNSSGSLALEAALPNSNYSNGSTGTNINTRLAAGSAQLGNGYMYISNPALQGGRPWGEIFTGSSLQPDIDNVYRFWLNNSGFSLDAPGNTGVLADVGGVATSVEISTGPKWGCITLLTNDANTFSGSLTINPTAFFQGYAQTSGSPFGDAAGDVNLNGGALYLSNNWNSSAAMVTKAHLNLQGQTALVFSTPTTSYNAKLTVTDIVRNNHAIMAISPTWGGSANVLGSNVQVFVTNPPANQNSGTMAPAYFVRYGGEGFLKYDSTLGFVDATFTATDSFGANDGTDIVNLTSTASTTISSGSKAWAVRAAGALTGGDVTIGSGGLILAGAPTSAAGKGRGGPASNLVSTTNINFGSAEGIIYTGTGRDPANIDMWYSGWNELTGTITGTGGLTIGGPFNGNGAPYVFISGNNTGLSGQVTINMGLVEINNANALGTGTIMLNGGTGGDGNSVMGALASNSPPLGTTSA